MGSPREPGAAGHAGKRRRPGAQPKKRQPPLDGILLFMKHRRKEVIWRVRFIAAEIAGFVYNNTELFHICCSLKEKAGNIPAVGGPGSCDQPVFLCILYAKMMKIIKRFINLFLSLTEHCKSVKSKRPRKSGCCRICSNGER